MRISFVDLDATSIDDVTEMSEETLNTRGEMSLRGTDKQFEPHPVSSSQLIRPVKQLNQFHFLVVI